MNQNEIKIRKAEERDHEAVNSLYHETYSLYHSNIPESYKKVPQKTLPKGTFLNMIEDKDSLVIVAETGGVVAGVLYAVIEKDEGDGWVRGYHRVSVEELSVIKRFHNSGIGTALMHEAEKWAKGRKIVDLTALVYAFNEKAINFYKKNGYKPYSIKVNKKI